MAIKSTPTRKRAYKRLLLIKDAVRNYIDETSLTNRELCKKTGHNESNFSHFLYNDRGMNLTTLLMIIDALDCKVCLTKDSVKITKVRCRPKEDIGPDMGEVPTVLSKSPWKGLLPK